MDIIRLNIDAFYEYREKIKELIKEAIYYNFPASIIEESYYSDTINDLENYIKSGSAIVYLAVNDNDLCGWIWCHEIHRFEKRRLHVAHFAVYEQYRKSGIGKLLLDTVEKFAHENNYSGLDLLVTAGNQSAVHFYEKQGYEIERYVLRKGF